MKLNDPDLTEYVKKEHDLDEGIFANINNDIASSISHMNFPPIILMASSYVRRIAANGLFLQGIFDKSSLDHATIMFASIQQITSRMMRFNEYADTVKFQEGAYSIAINFTKTYDNRFSRDIFSNLLASVNHVLANNIKIRPIPYDLLMEKVVKDKG